MPRWYALIICLLVSNTAAPNPNNVKMFWYDFSNLLTGTVSFNLPRGPNHAIQLMAGSSYAGIGYLNYFDVSTTSPDFNPFYRLGTYIDFRGSKTLYPYVYIGTHTETAHSGLSYGLDVGYAAIPGSGMSLFSNFILTINF